MNPFEFYETPAPAIEWLFEEFAIKGRVFEPCVGSGAILRHSRAAPGRRTWITNDLDPRWPAAYHLDAAQPDLWARVGRVDWVVSNTAFSIAGAVARRALETGASVALHVRASFNEPLKGKRKKGGGRKEDPRDGLFADYPISDLLWLPRFAYQRSQSTGKWSTDSVCCVWLVWRPIAIAQTIRYAPPRIIDAHTAITTEYRQRMDALMAGRAA